MPHHSSPPKSVGMQGAQHIVKVVTRATGGWAPDAEGRTSTTSTTTNSYEQLGRVVQLSTRELAAGRYEQGVVAALLVPLDSKITQNDQIVVEEINRFLDGTYEVSAVRYTPQHLRVLLRRTE